MIGPCMCGALDCKSCGPAQGYYDYEDSDDGYDPQEEDILWDERRWEKYDDE